MRQAQARPGGQAGLIAAAASARVRRVTLPPAQCAALRRRLRDPSASCTIAETLRLTPVRTLGVRTAGAATAGVDMYWIGYLQACAVVYSSGYCDTSKWWAYDEFNVVTNGTDAWNYGGAPTCGSNGTNITWCGYVDNGTATLSEGFNFGSGGYARLDAEGSGAYYVEPFNSWENASGYIIDEGT